MGCGNQANVHANRSRTPQSLKLMFLQSAQQLGLQIETDITDFIQKESALICQLEPALLLHKGSGERALFMTKQFALYQPGGYGGTIQVGRKCARDAG